MESDVYRRTFIGGVAAAALVAPIASARAQSKVTITVAQWGTDAELSAMRHAVQHFNAGRSDIQVQFVAIPHPSYNQQLDTQLAGGSGPDVFKQVYGWYGHYEKNGAALDLTDLLPANTADQYAETYWKAGQYGGKQYALPMNTDELMVFYNKEAFRKAGLPNPPDTLDKAWTLDQFLDVARALKRAEATQYAFTSYGRFPRTFLLLVEAFGGSILSPDRTKANLSGPEGIAAIKWLTSTFQDGFTPISTIWNAPDDTDILFTQGRTAMAVTGCWNLPLFDQKISNFSYGVTFLPRGKQASADLGGGGFLINRATPNPRQAVEVLLYLTGPASMTDYLIPNYFLPTRADLQSAGVSYPGHADLMKLFVQQTRAVQPDMISTLTNPNYAQFETILAQEVGQALRGRKTAEQAARDADDKMNAIIKTGG